MEKQQEEFKSRTESMSKSRVGDRYFRIDPGYDKRVYENDLRNWIRIFYSFAIFYTCCIFMWWGFFEIGTYKPESTMMLFIVIFIISIIVSSLPC